MNVPGLVRFFEERRDRGVPLVLATIFETSGSTYSKAGTHMLVDGAGDFQGMLSGGCLEGDLALRASQVIETGEPQAVTYDLAQDDELWGLGVGCDGVMRVFLQALLAGNGYEPFQAIAAAMQADEPSALAMVIESGHPDAPPGAAAIGEAGRVRGLGLADAVAERLLRAVRRPVCERVLLDEDPVSVLNAAINPLPRLLVLGAGHERQDLGFRDLIGQLRQGDLLVFNDTRVIPARLAAVKDTGGRAEILIERIEGDSSALAQVAATR